MIPVADGAAPSKLRVVVVGAGQMGRSWLRVVADSADAELVGVVDLDVALAARVLAEERLLDVAVGSELETVVSASDAEAVVNVTVPRAHHAISTAAMRLGLPVLSEKPVAPTLAEALSLAATSEVTGCLLMVSQSRRYLNALRQFREVVKELGPLGMLSTHFFRAPHFGGFREEMDEPLLVDMAIHSFDVARYLLDDEPTLVSCQSFNPPWSWYRGAAAAHAVFDFRLGARYTYVGSWCSPGFETSWNGEWRASGALGTATWDGTADVRVDITDRVIDPTSFANGDRPEGIAGALAEFVDAVRTRAVPSGEVHANVMSLAMVEAAVLSSRKRREAALPEVLDSALSDSIRAEADEDVRVQLGAAGTSLWGDRPLTAIDTRAATKHREVLGRRSLHQRETG
jgi:predicted dehydrogenase